MVNLGNGAKADQVLDETGEGGDVSHAAEDGIFIPAIPAAGLVAGQFTK